MKDEYFAQIYTNSTTKQVENHKIYLQKSVVCLQKHWSKAFSFVSQSFKEFFQYLMSKVSNKTDDKLAKQETYDFVKLKYSKSQLVTKTVDMPQFGVDFEPLFMFEVLLSPDRLQSKRSTLNMV